MMKNKTKVSVGFKAVHNKPKEKKDEPKETK